MYSNRISQNATITIVLVHFNNISPLTIFAQLHIVCRTNYIKSLRVSHRPIEKAIYYRLLEGYC